MVRERRPTDLPACVAMLARVHAADRYPVRWQDDPAGWLTPKGLRRGWVAERDGRLLGHVAVCRPVGDLCATFWARRAGRSVTEAAVISRLFVAPEARGTGVGRRLLAHAVDQARADGWHPVLDVMALNESAVRMYDALGWRRLGTVELLLYGEPMPMHCYAYAPLPAV